MTESAMPWPGYRAAPEKFNLAMEALDAPIARGCAAHAALVGEHGAITYGSLQRRVNSLATSLIDLGLRRGDLVLIKLSNSPEFATAFLAAVRLGIVPVLVNSLLSAGN
jgi:benzoate-CoA ligase